MPFSRYTLPKLRDQLDTWRKMRVKYEALGWPPGFPQGEFDHRIAQLEHELGKRQQKEHTHD